MREKQVDGIMALPETFPGTVAVIPRFEELVTPYRAEDGSVDFPDGVTARALLQQATRDILTGMGLDVSGLTDAQMSDNHGWVLFPNFFMTIRAGECHVVMAMPHPDGDPNRCIWHVASYMYLPAELRDAFKAEPDRGRRAGQLQVLRGAAPGLRADAAPAARPAQRPARPHVAGEGGSRHRALPLRSSTGYMSRKLTAVDRFEA